ncbi:transcription-associated protein 1, partial [Dispira parvispora]
MEVDKPSPSEPTVQSAEGVPKDNLEATPLTKSDANSPVLSDAKPEATGSPKEKPDAGTSLEDSKASDGKQAEGAFPLTAKDAVTVKTEPEESDSGQISASQPTSANDTTHSPRAPESGQGLSTQQAQNPPDEAEGDTPLDPETRHQRAKFNSLIVLLITELTNPNAHVREAAQACYELLSQLTGQSVTHLLIPVRERLLRPIFAKPLRALSPHMQIGNTDAITYCLSLHPSFLAISEPLVRLLNEALALADAEDQALVNRTVHSKGPGSLVTLRLVCLKLLSAAMANSEFTASRHNPMQARIISVFFKSLYSKSQEIVEVANRGLQHVLTQLPKLPKELLQTGLRPILMSLSDHRRLSVHGLEALARMLKLLNSYFKAEIGRKLLDHLQQLANPNLLADISSKPLQDIEEIKVIVAVLHVFHLLPPSANIFLPELVKITLQMEEQICRDTSSPFRAPLFQYLNQYPTESVRYFLEQLHDTRPTRLFVALLHSEEGSVLREQLMKDPGTLLASLGLISSGEGDVPVSVTADKGSPESSDPTGNAMVVDDPKPQASPSGNGPPPPIKDDTVSTKPPTDANADNPAPNPSSRLRTFFHAVDILHTLAVCQPKWFADQPAVVEAFVEGLRSPLFKERLTSLSESFALDDAYSCYTAAECLMSIIPHVPNRSQLVLELLPLCGPVGRFDVVALRQYYWETVCLQFSSTDKQAILSQFLDSLLDLSIPVDTKVRTLKFLINPMILASLQDKAIDPVLNDALMDQLSTKLWGCIPNKLTPEQRQHFTDYFVIEILQLTSIVVEYAPHLMNEAKKMVILFSWSFIKQDDLATKHSAYVLLARFIAAFETPPKICNQIFVALLRAHQSEARGLVRQALQCMTPMLPQRLPAGSGDGQLPTWVRWIKKILVEDGHGVLQMINIYQLLVRHYEMFYDHRDQFLPHIVNVLTKLNVVQSTTTEARTLAIDLVDLVLKWERMRLRQSTGGGNDTQGGSAVPSEHAMEEVSSNHSGPVVPQKRSADQISLDQPPYDERSPTAKPKSSSPQTAPNSPPAPARYLREAILNYLVRLICFSGDTSSTHNMVPRALILLQAFLSPGLWDDIPPKLTHFERVLGNPDITEATLGSVCNTLEVLHVLLERAHSEWWLRHIRAVSDLLTKVLHSDYPAVAKALFPILKCLYRVVYTQQDAMDEDNDNADSAHFINLVDSFITESLQNTANLYGALRALEAKSAVKPEGLDTFIPGLVKLVQKLTREHIEHPQTSSSSSTGKGLPTPTMPLSVGSSVGSQPTATTPGGATNLVTNEGALDSPLNLLIITLTLLKLR